MNSWLLLCVTIGYTSIASATDECLPTGRQIFMFNHADEGYAFRVWLFDEIQIMIQSGNDPVQIFPGTGLEDRIGIDGSSDAGMYLNDTTVTDTGNYSVVINFFSGVGQSGPNRLVVEADASLAEREVTENSVLKINGNITKIEAFSTAVNNGSTFRFDIDNTMACIPTPHITITNATTDTPIIECTGFSCSWTVDRSAYIYVTVSVSSFDIRVPTIGIFNITLLKQMALEEIHDILNDASLSPIYIDGREPVGPNTTLTKSDFQFTFDLSSVSEQLLKPTYIYIHLDGKLVGMSCKNTYICDHYFTAKDNGDVVIFMEIDGHQEIRYPEYGVVMTLVNPVSVACIDRLECILPAVIVPLVAVGVAIGLLIYFAPWKKHERSRKGSISSTASSKRGSHQRNNPRPDYD